MNKVYTILLLVRVYLERHLHVLQKIAVNGV